MSSIYYNPLSLFIFLTVLVQPFDTYTGVQKRFPVLPRTGQFIFKTINNGFARPIKFGNAIEAEAFTVPIKRRLHHEQTIKSDQIVNADNSIIRRPLQEIAQSVKVPNNNDSNFWNLSPFGNDMLKRINSNTLQEIAKEKEPVYKETMMSDLKDKYQQKTASLQRYCTAVNKSEVCCTDMTRSLMWKGPESHESGRNNTEPRGQRCQSYCITVGLLSAVTDVSCEEHLENIQGLPVISETPKTMNILFNKTTQVFYHSNETDQEAQSRTESATSSDIDRRIIRMLHMLYRTIATEAIQVPSTIKSTSDSPPYLAQWFEFIREKRINERIFESLWKMLFNHLDLDENLSLKGYRLCDINYNLDLLNCTEIRYSYLCLIDEEACNDGALAIRMSKTCRNFTIRSGKLGEVQAIPCNLSKIANFSEKSEFTITDNVGGIIVEKIQLKILQNLKKETFNEHNDENDHKFNSDIKVKTEGKTGWSVNKYEKSKSVTTNTTKTSIINKILTTNWILPTTINNREDYWTSNRSNTTTTTPIIDIRTTATESQTMSSREKETERFQPITAFLSTSKIISSTETTKTSSMATTGAIEFIKRNNNLVEDLGKLGIIKDNKAKTQALHKSKVPWRRFELNCSEEQDHYKASSCSAWIDAGYCATSEATKFLWCRKTCLCDGPKHE